VYIGSALTFESADGIAGDQSMAREESGGAVEGFSTWKEGKKSKEDET